MSNGRLIAFRHRIKRTAEGEARPTQVYILGTGGKVVNLALEDDDAELRFALGLYEVKKMTYGLEAGDTVLMALGGSGDNLAYALTRRGEEIGATVWRIPPYHLSESRATEGDKASKDDDTERLIHLWGEHPDWFYQVRPRDKALIRVRELQRTRVDAMKDRIACEQRLRSACIGAVFTCDDGLYPEGGIEQAFALAKTTNPSLLALEKYEHECVKALERALKKLDVYEQVLGVVKGCGPAIAGRLITGVQDIRRFETDAKLKAFCGVHVTTDGKFPRKRVGQKCNWSPECRQALYLLADQFNRQTDSFWGKKLRENKARLRAKHPEQVTQQSGGKNVTLYTDGHIHKMAIWKTLSQFVRWLWKAWMTLEKTGSYSLPTPATA